MEGHDGAELSVITSRPTSTLDQFQDFACGIMTDADRGSGFVDTRWWAKKVKNAQVQVVSLSRTEASLTFLSLTFLLFCTYRMEWGTEKCKEH